MLDVDVIEDPAAAAAALEPVRSRLLSELSAPASAATLATRLGIARQKINYHLRALEAHGLVRMAGTRKWGGLTERLLVASAASYVVSPDALGPVAADPERLLVASAASYVVSPGALGPAAADPARAADRLSASYLIALGARVVREVSDLLRRSREADKRLASLSIDAEVRFRSPAERAAFTGELTRAVTALVARYHDDAAPGGRSHRLVIVAHPTPTPNEAPGKEPSCP